MDPKVAFLELFRGGSGTRLRTPFGAHLERRESSFGVESELNCGRIGAHFLSSAKFVMQLISQLNSMSQIDTTQRSTQLHSNFTSTQRSSFHELNSLLNSTQLKIEVNSANSTQPTFYSQFNSAELFPLTQLTIELSSTHN